MRTQTVQFYFVLFEITLKKLFEGSEGQSRIILEFLMINF